MYFLYNILGIIFFLISPFILFFRIINGKEDNLIPLKSSLLMQELTPLPKKIILLDGKHMGVGKQQKELLNTIIEKTRKWLVENNAINNN